MNYIKDMKGIVTMWPGGMPVPQFQNREITLRISNDHNGKTLSLSDDENGVMFQVKIDDLSEEIMEALK